MHVHMEAAIDATVSNCVMRHMCTCCCCYLGSVSGPNCSAALTIRQDSYLSRSEAPITPPSCRHSRYICCTMLFKLMQTKVTAHLEAPEEQPHSAAWQSSADRASAALAAPPENIFYFFLYIAIDTWNNRLTPEAMGCDVRARHRSIGPPHNAQQIAG